MEAPIILTGNIRTWREIFEKRISEYAELEIKDVCDIILLELYNLIPHCLPDFQEQFCKVLNKMSERLK